MKAGAIVWAVSPDEPEKLRNFQRDEGIEFPILVDTDNEVSISYGLLNESKPTVPHPTAIIIDTDGVIRYSRVDENYKVRPSPEELLDALAKL